MKFKCNFDTCGGTISTFDSIDSFNSAQTSGIVNIQNDIDNGALGQKYYFCPKCKSKLLWQKKYEANNNNLGGAVGTFTILNDDDKTEATITGQHGIDDPGHNGGGQQEVEILPEYGQSRFKYKKTEWISSTETEEQKNSISWTDSRTGQVYYGTKAMNNIEKGVFEANRKYSFKELQTKNLASALMKLRMNKETSIAMWGDSIFAGFWYLEDEAHKEGVYEADSFTDDYGMKYEGYDRCVKRIPEVMVETLNKVYGDKKITMSRRVWNGITVCNKKTAKGKPVDYSITSHWKASEKDIAIMNFGINDAIGIHLDMDYAGDVSQFIEGYKALIERELEHGTAVIIMSPVRLCTVGEKNIMADLDDRTIIDVYEQSLFSLCQEYGIPFVDGSLMLKSFGSELYLDLSHLQPEGNESIGKRLASILIGQNPLRPLKVNHNTYLSVIPQYSNCKLTGTANLSYSETSPNIQTGVDIDMKYPEKPGTTPPSEEDSTEPNNPTVPEGDAEEPNVPTDPEEQEGQDQDQGEDKEEGQDQEQEEGEEGESQEEDQEGQSSRTSAPTTKPTVTITKPTGAIQCELKKDGDSIVWSFYAEHDGMVVIPTFENSTDAGKVKMELDFGANQGSWANYWNFVSSTGTIDRKHKEASTVEYEKSDLTDNKFGYHMLGADRKKAIKIVSEGWHTVRLEANGLADKESIKVYGLTFMDIKEFENAVKAK